MTGGRNGDRNEGIDQHCHAARPREGVPDRVAPSEQASGEPAGACAVHGELAVVVACHSSVSKPQGKGLG
jgi:hypothetical protein